MKRLTAVAAVRALTRQWRRAGLTQALVPTMGNLHRGHLALIDEARRRADRVAASIFVNPTQFGPGEDYRAYPRTTAQDLALLEARGCDLVLTPSVDQMYPGGHRSATVVTVPELTQDLCGAARPGHFTGVASVVSRLFNIFQPDLAVFGEKDYQQLLVIRRLVEDLHFGLEIVGHPTVREPSGLALSSRNRYLSDEQRTTAAAIYRTLCWVRDELSAGAGADATLAAATARLAAAGLVPEYVEIRRAADLRPAAAADRDLVVLAAARLGPARLIDNLRVGPADGDSMG